MLRPVRFLPDQQIEAAASALLRRSRAAGVWDGAPPIPVELIAEAVLDLRVGWKRLDAAAAGERTLGMLAVAEKTLYRNEDERESFQRNPGMEHFTVAHEIGHYELHVEPAAYMQLRLDEPEDIVLCRSGDRSPREFQAERFASYLLMPVDLVREAVSRDVQLDWQAVRRLARLFGASSQAMRIRLEGLGAPLA